MPHIIIHQGFHKTGTSSLQHFLRANRPQLSEYCRIFLKPKVAEWVRCATDYSVTGGLTALIDLRYSILKTLQTGYAGQKPLIISCEGLSGRVPGKSDIMDYSAALPLANCISETLFYRFPKNLNLTFVYTTRDPESWLYSSYRHNLIGYRITDDFERYAKIYRPAANLAAMVGTLRQALPKCTVIEINTSKTMDSNQGHIKTILDLLNIPQETQNGLTRFAAQNRGPNADFTRQLLQLNCSNLSDSDLRIAKYKLRDNWQKP